MAKQITVKDPDGKSVYTLEFSRKTVELMERQGFSASDLTDKPATCIPALFAGAFRMHHNTLKREKIDEIYRRLKNKSDLLGGLVEMYNEPLIALIEGSESDDENFEWAMSE